jgi:hypothetical protein
MLACPFKMGDKVWNLRRMKINDSPGIRKLIGHRALAAVALCVPLLFLSACASSNVTAQEGGQKKLTESPYTGLWVAPENDKTSFELDLTQNGSLIEGYHAALVGDTGNIEAALRTDREGASVRGSVGGDGFATVKFELRKYRGSGEATLSLKGDRLKWKLTSTSGDSVLPKTCVLFKQMSALH